MSRRSRWLLAASALLVLIAALAWAWLAVALRPGDGAETLAVSVPYVTTRAREAVTPDGVRYGGRRGERAFGTCTMRFRPIPGARDVAERLEFWIPTERRSVAQANEQTAETFWTDLDATMARAPEAPVVLFAHGYAFGFDRTCRMGAELQRRLGTRAPVVLFTWPSDANPADYVADQVDVEWSVPALAELIATLGQRYGAGRLKVVAHSLGTRGVLQALERLQADGAEEALLAHLVLLAPDYDAAAFRERLPRLRPLLGAVTIYASALDAPLAVSATLHGYPRLGQAGETLTVLPGVETIDVTPVGRYQLSGHVYHYYHPIVAADLVTLLLAKPHAGDRPRTERRTADGLPYWVLTRPP